MKGRTRRVLIDDDAEAYASPGYELTPEGDAGLAEPDESEGDEALAPEVLRLRADGWPSDRIAAFLSVSVADVEAIDGPDYDDGDDFAQTPQAVYGLEPDGDEW